MAELELDRTADALIGRERECAVLQRLLDAAERGEGGALVVRGEPGIGKTALLDYADGRAGSMIVLRATGVGEESDLAFAGLHGLLHPIVDRLDQLVETQSRALAGALGLAASSGRDRFLVSAAVLGLLAAAADQSPVLCLVDDAQWLDSPSVDALLFAARRLRAERVAMVFGAREEETPRFGGGALQELALTSVEPASAAAILALRAPELAAAVRERLLGEAAGNPLALLELPAALTKAQLVGQEPLPDAIPLTSRLQALFGRRIDQLQFETQAALLIAAADNTGELAAVAGAAAELELSADALDPAETSGLIRATGGVIKFRHPLVRSALYERASLSQRQRVHSALASALSGDQHADRRVWHQAMAAVGGDEEVAAALEASARRAQLRAGHASAASAYVRAAELTVDESRLVPRLTAAAEAAWDAGQADRARALIVRALPIAEGMLRARLLHLRGVIESRGGNMRDAVSTLIEGADASSNPSLTLEMLLETADAAVEMGDRARVAELGARASKLPTRTARDQFSREVLIGFAELFAGEYERARARFDDALRLAGELDDALVQVWAAWAASLGLGLGAGLPFATRAVELARRQGLLSMLPIALDQQAAELFRNSNFDLAYAAAEEGYRLSLDLGQGLGWHLMTMARVEAIWGREAEAREHAEQVLSLAQRGGDTGLATTARATLGLVELTIGRPEAAANSLLELAAELPDTVPIIVPTVIPDTVEAVVRAGLASELVDEPLAAFRAWVLQAPSDARRAQLALCEALAGHRPAEEAFTEAIALSGALPPFQRARGELIYGEWLRRERRRADARVHLRAAIELFRTVGATPWERRAEAELRATGETARKRDPSTLDQLTPQELQVARLAAEGMTNPQIGAQLFLSPRTVEYHLRKVFSKLGIASRNELIRHGVPRRDTP